MTDVLIFPVPVQGMGAGEEIALADQLDRMRMRYYAGPAEDAEGWESLGR